MSYHVKCEREIDELARAMVREAADLREIVGTLREYWTAEWHNERERIAEQFNAAQAGLDGRHA